MTSSYTLAKAAGHAMYAAPPCKRCGCTVRMTNTCACQGCEEKRKANKLSQEQSREQADANRQAAAELRSWRCAMQNVRYNGDHEYPDAPPYNLTHRPPLRCNTSINQWELEV